MKKNAMLKIAAILMVAVLLTTCAISSTFAKYVTSGSDSVEARVAAFGYTLNTEITSDGFLSNYATTDTTKYTGTNSVSSVLNPQDLVIAPGTSGTLAYTSAISVGAKHEVAVAISSSAVFTWSNNDYCPLIFTIDNETYATKDHTADNTYNNPSLLMEAINDLLSFDYELAPGADSVTIGEDEVDVADLFESKSIAWTWNFNESDDNDEKDTALGNNSTTVIKLGFTLTQSITQID